MRAEQVTDPVAYHGEGPVWSPQWGGLRWLDMLAGDVLSLRADGSIGRLHVGKVAAAIRPRRAGGAVIGVERGFALEDAAGMVTDLPTVWDDPGLRMNEGACDPQGRFYCGSMAYDRTPGAASLYRLDTDHSVHCVLDGVSTSNGLDWSPDGSRAYYNDTPTQRIDVFDYDPDTGLTNRRVFADLSADGLRPDGLTVDSEGGVWVALNGDGTVRRYDASGRNDETIELPPRRVTACTFGGPELDELFITTSRENLAPDEQPLAGALFRVSPGVRGKPVLEFDG
jgi:sugar lactone lactonase YvrE